MKEGIAIGVVSACIAATLFAGSAQHVPERPPSGVVSTSGAGRLVGARAAYAFPAHAARVTARTIDGTRAVPLDLELVVDGEPRPLPVVRLEALPGDQGIFAAFALEFTDGPVAGKIRFRVDAATDGLVAEVVPNEADVERAAAHGLALRATAAAGHDVLFASGVGEIADVTEVRGGAIVLEDEAHPLAVTSAHGLLEIKVARANADREHDHEHEDEMHATGQLVVSATSPAVRADWGRSDLRIVLAPADSRAWTAIHRLAGAAVARVHGVVTGAPPNGRAIVYGLDVEGLPQVRTVTEADGRFEVEVPKTVTQWYAALDPARTSAPITFEPGTPWDLRLDVSAGGELHVRIVDGDTGQAITARLIVHGIDGTLDPSFGPDYRASGAGPIIDSLKGDVTTPLPAGRYRVAATRGLEWSVDAKVIDVAAGHGVTIDLAPRHVVPTPGVIGCDLHVHARPSFDTPVSVEDRVLSLVAAGVDFAVPTEHNIVGDYGPAVNALEVGKELAHTHGVEVTTYAPRLGHFGLFPYPLDKRVPPYRHSSIPAVFNAAHKGDPTRILQVNHPRLPKGIGYFEIVGFDPKQKPVDWPRRMRTDFDTIEVYNGYEMASQARVDLALADWFALLNGGRRYAATGSSDSHRIQYQWAGYPRTLIDIGPTADGPADGIDPLVVVARLKKGHAIVTSGPVVELDVRGAKPGDDAPVSSADASVPVHAVVRAAPWVDVTSLEIVVDGKVAKTIRVEPRPTKIGVETGTRDEAQERTIRWQGTVDVPVSTTARYVVAIARGTRPMDDVLPFMPVAPMAITNPIWLVRTSGDTTPR